MKKNYILVADDSAMVQNAVRMWLEGAFPENPVLVADTVESAMEAFTTHTVHAVISDYEMPDVGDGALVRVDGDSGLITVLDE